MPIISLRIGNGSYDIACNEGEQDNIRSLAQSLNVRMSGTSKSFPTASESMVLAVTALMMEDEMRSLRSGRNIPLPPEYSDSALQDRVNREVAATLAPFVDRLETLAKNLETV